MSLVSPPSRVFRMSCIAASLLPLATWSISSTNTTTPWPERSTTLHMRRVSARREGFFKYTNDQPFVTASLASLNASKVLPVPYLPSSKQPYFNGIPLARHFSGYKILERSGCNSNSVFLERTMNCFSMPASVMIVGSDRLLISKAWFL